MTHPEKSRPEAVSSAMPCGRSQPGSGQVASTLQRMRVDALYGAAIHEVHVQLAGAVRRRELWFTAELDACGNRVRACVDRRGHLGVAVHHEHPLARGIVDHAIRILVRRNLLQDA